MKNKIHALVRAQIQVHAATTLLALEKVRAELDRIPVNSPSRAKILRRTREQLVVQLDAWEYLHEVANSGHYQAYREANDLVASARKVKAPAATAPAAADPDRCMEAHPETGGRCIVSVHLFHREHVTDKNAVWDDDDAVPETEPAEPETDQKDVAQ